MFFAAEPASAVDMNEEGRGLLGIDSPKVKNHVLVRAIGYLLVGRLDLSGEKRREKKKGKKRSKVFAEHEFLSVRTIPWASFSLPLGQVCESIDNSRCVLF